jgi:hypothetical protein
VKVALALVHISYKVHFLLFTSKLVYSFIVIQGSHSKGQLIVCFAKLCPFFTYIFFSCVNFSKSVKVDHFRLGILVHFLNCNAFLMESIFSIHFCRLMSIFAFNFLINFFVNYQIWNVFEEGDNHESLFCFIISFYYFLYDLLQTWDILREKKTQSFLRIFSKAVKTFYEMRRRVQDYLAVSPLLGK